MTEISREEYTALKSEYLKQRSALVLTKRELGAANRRIKELEAEARKVNQEWIERMAAAFDRTELSVQEIFDQYQNKVRAKTDEELRDDNR